MTSRISKIEVTHNLGIKSILYDSLNNIFLLNGDGCT